jgi:AmpD protein
MKIIKHILDIAEYIPSPNQNRRPVNTEIDLIVVHGISLPPEEFGGPYIAQFFKNELDIEAHPNFKPLLNVEVSAHIVIYRSGHIQQFVPFNMRAWHAGISSYQGRHNCNDYSIGIELEGTDYQPYEAIQYQHLAKLIQCLMQTYPMITSQRIVGHCDVAPDRKTDPGRNFDWEHLKALLSSA